MIDFTNDTNGGGSFSTAMLSYPTGNEALTDTTLYNYIKTLYDAGFSAVNKNFTIYGTPTISNSGLISGISSDNYLITIPFTLSNTFEIVVRAKVNNDLSESQVVYGAGGENTSSLMIIVTTDYRVKLSVFYTAEESATGQKQAQSDANVIEPNIYYYFKVIFNGTNYTLNISTDGTNYTTIATLQWSSLPYRSSNIKMAIGATVTSQAWSPYSEGDIDINSFCIKNLETNKIIYSTSYVEYKRLSTGARVVDISKVENLNSYYRTHGSALYYVIDTSNQTIRLPMGDIYGFLTQAMEQPSA